MSRITCGPMPAVAEWQSRPLDAICSVVLLDGRLPKVRRDTH
ncbi:MAG: transposase [Bacillota bacterium]